MKCILLLCIIAVYKKAPRLSFIQLLIEPSSVHVAAILGCVAGTVAVVWHEEHGVLEWHRSISGHTSVFLMSTNQQEAGTSVVVVGLVVEYESV